ncbi:Uncharacterized conserved protein YqhQ [Butyrivibrio sp. ob235]|uniref:DUF1385 domain-containing protein n=1 Tax=unclassified Butyrivibrio TaxID=2639466 RepID=UPI0003B763C8|nr:MULTISPECIES: DUF1385 domain-containing protein [unclassified Butyrivibrio]SEL46259.1 Uncharacterized conserved protein YqhQ [Butyrivibrio sp. ob235]
MGKKKITHYSGIGGQAVLEGVMMRNKDMYAVAVRKENGEIAVEVDHYLGKGDSLGLTHIPFIRGVFAFWDSLVLGMKSLNFSASLFGQEEIAQAKDPIAAESREKVATTITTVVAFVIAIGIFMVLPYYLSSLFNDYIRNNSVVVLIEGGIRIAIFILYVLLISLMKDIRRLFRYHGAEHKCINCLERGKPLTLENVKESTRLHKRCGSSFLLFVMFVSIILFFFIRVQSIPLRILVRIALIPVIAGISYEIIRLAGRSNNIIMKIISAPGLLLQMLTTKEPDDEMIEVGIKSVEAVFDWREFLEDSFGYKFEDDEEIAE